MNYYARQVELQALENPSSASASGEPGFMYNQIPRS
jgi:hypothetical protein